MSTKPFAHYRAQVRRNHYTT